MSNKEFDVTIVVPTFNGEEFIEDLIKAVLSQKTRLKYELLIIDSGSSDKTIEIIKRYPEVRLHTIPNKEFGHGRTRNLGASLVNSTYVVFLTDDAVPAHDKWLDYMVEPFGLNDKVACVFGKQIPRPHCFISIKREVSQVFKSFSDDGSISLQRKTPLTQKLNLTNNFMSDVNSAIKKDIWQKIKYKNVDYAEDQLMGIDLLDAGYIKAYSPLGSVFHSHDYSLRVYFKRKFDEYVGLRKTTGYVAQAGIKELTLGSMKSSIQDLIFLYRDKELGRLEKIHDLILLPFYNIALRLAIRRAAKSRDEKSIEKYSLEHQERKLAKD